MTSTEELESQIQAQDCELEYWLQQADNYAEIQIPADDLRAIIARTYAAVNALPELLAVKAERDRAQRACEQMGARITEMENSLREIGAAIINGATDTLWMGDQISDETVVDFICNLTGDDPSLLGTFARAALKETGQ